jgi:hypothetical protein
MFIDIEFSPIADVGEWAKLQSSITAYPNEAVDHLIAHLQSLGACFVVIENKYIDRDWSAEYGSFYAKMFKSFDRVCKRYHFFKKDLSKELDPKNPWKARCDALTKCSVDGEYLGFTVITPMPHAPLGRTVVAPFQNITNSEATLAIRAEYKVHLMGAKLCVNGAPFMQQDNRVGACAQSAIWMAARHMHTRYGYPWHSLATITEYGATPTDRHVSQSIPAGADFLTGDGMARALRGMGYQPLCYEAEGEHLLDIIIRYVDSGLPVVIGLRLPDKTGQRSPNNTEGHAVLVVGTVLQENHEKIPAPDKRCTTAYFTRGLIVHDDQRGPYRLLASNPDAINANCFPGESLISARNTVLNVWEDAVYVLVPMPAKVFSKAEAADIQARKVVKDILDSRDNLAQKATKQEKKLDPLFEDLAAIAAKEPLIFRTYLTSAGRYRTHISSSLMHEMPKVAFANMHLPHFVWVTEVAPIHALNHNSPNLRKVSGHIVADATSSTKHGATQIMVHLPGLLVLNDVETGKEVAHFIPGPDVVYEPREKKLKS